MDRQQIGLMLCLNRLNIPLAMSTFDERLILQKAVCILQHAGVDLGYFYNWHVRGPYCPSLANDLFQIVPNVSNHNAQVTTWSLDPKSEIRLEQILPAFETPSGQSTVRYLEICASILYVCKNDGIDASNPEVVNARLTERGKRFRIEEVTEAIDKLVDVKFFEK